jgi:SAM-dependent methyltransferase
MELNELFFEIHNDMPRQGPGRNRYTRQAFEMLPALDTPRILDIGCGPGQPTIELAKLSGGEVTGIDVYEQYLDQLREAIDAENLGHRVKAVNCSMFDIDLPGDFDIVWAEGSIFIIGFKRGLEEWRCLVRPGGFLVVHEVAWIRPDPPPEIVDFWQAAYPAIAPINDNIEIIERAGYRLLGHFPLPEDAWWHAYYGPLEERITALRVKYAGDREALAQLDDELVEIDMFRKYNRWYGSVFFVMQRPE